VEGLRIRLFKENNKLPEGIEGRKRCRAPSILLVLKQPTSFTQMRKKEAQTCI
jgi:hypothetical protein